MKVAIIGSNLQGRRRAPAVRDNKETQLVAVSSAHRERAEALAVPMGCEAVEGWEPIIRRRDIDAVIICTPTNLHHTIAMAAIAEGKHVLCEKPLALNVKDAEEMTESARRKGVTLKCGFNHRHHPGLQQAHAWVTQGAIGDLMYARCRYGIGGRPGYEKEWRGDPAIVGGGHLLEHGIHALDLFRWFAGDASQVFAYTNTSFWDMRPLEDNAFVLLHTNEGVVFSLHSSLTQWTNLFSFEVFGKDGYVRVEGLGGSYGVEEAALSKRDFTAPFSEEVVQFRSDDRSWHQEWNEFVEAVKQKREPLGNGKDGVEALRLVHAAYQSARENRVVHL